MLTHSLEMGCLGVHGIQKVFLFQAFFWEGFSKRQEAGRLLLLGLVASEKAGTDLYFTSLRVLQCFFLLPVAERKSLILPRNLVGCALPVFRVYFVLEFCLGRCGLDHFQVCIVWPEGRMMSSRATPL